MSQNLAPLLGAAVIAALVGLGAGYLGATLAQPDPVATPDGADQADGISGLRKDVEELDRRLDDTRASLAVTEETANVAFDRGPEIDRLLDRVRALEARLDAGGDAPPGPAADSAATSSGDGDGPVPATGPERDALDEARRQELIKKSREIFGSNARKFLPFELNMIADATEDGAAARRSQVYGLSRRMAVQYRLTREKELALRKLLLEEMDAAVRDVAPYLKGGLERADFSQVKAQLTSVWESRDAGMRGILDEEQYKEYAEDEQNRRRVYGEILDEWENDRLSRR